MTYKDIENIKGDTIASISADGDSVVITTESNQTWRMEHHQDCCESVSLNEQPHDLLRFEGWQITDASHGTRECNDSCNSSDCCEHEHTVISFTVKNPIADVDDYGYPVEEEYLEFLWDGYSNGYYGTGVSVTVHGEGIDPRDDRW